MFTTAVGLRRGVVLAVGATVLGGAATVVSPFLPWVKASSGARTASMSGLDAGWGVPIAFAAGILAVLLGVMMALGVGPWRLAVQLGLVAGIAAVAVGWIAVRDASDPAVSFLVSRDDTRVTYRAGAGVWLLLLGGSVTIAGSIASGVLGGRPVGNP